MTANIDGSDVDFGPLTGLIGRWAGDKGSDVAPEPDGSEESPYYETIVFSAAGDVENAESQELVAVHYHQIVSRKSNDEVFHNETGYWMWDAAQGVVMHSLTIPRAVCVLAGGTVKNENPVVFEVAARLDGPDWGIIQSPFMKGKARTLEFRHKVTLDGDQLSYSETTIVEIYGRVFEHTDQNELRRL